MLSFDNHILSTVSSCNSTLCQINRAKHVFSKGLLITVISCLVFSKLYYCSSRWSSTSCINKGRLQGVKNFATRVVSNSKKFDYITPVLKDLRWIPVKSHLYYRDALVAFKCMNNCAPAKPPLSGIIYIDPALKLCKSFPSFKVKLKHKLLQQYLDN